MASISLQPESADPLAEHPNFVTRFPWQFHADAEEIKANVQAWIIDRWPFSSQKHAEKFKAMAIEDCSTMLVYGAHKNRAEIHTLGISLSTLYDDVVEHMSIEDSESITNRLCLCISGDEGPDALNAVEQIIMDFVRMAREATSSVTGMDKITERYMEAFCQYIQGAGAKKERKAVLDQGTQKFLEYRVKDIGALFGMLGQLWAREIVVPENIFCDQEIIDLHNAFHFQQVLLNDMYSYRKERRLHDKLQGAAIRTPQAADGYIWCNILCILMQHDRMNPAEAMAENKRLTSYYEGQFAEILENLRIKYADSEEDLAGVNGLGQAMMDLMGGVAHWYDYSDRYNKGFSPKP